MHCHNSFVNYANPTRRSMPCCGQECQTDTRDTHNTCGTLRPIKSQVGWCTLQNFM